MRWVALRGACRIAVPLAILGWLSVSHIGLAAEQTDAACSTEARPGELCRCRVSDLHPTQHAVGLREVNRKQEQVKKIRLPDREAYLRKNPESTVIGPGGMLFIIDGHHLARALFAAGITTTYCQIEGNFARTDAAAFWLELAGRDWIHPFDAEGNGPLPPETLPASIGEMKDDPYRSLAGFVRDAGGFRRSPAPFAEFRWANFFRARISRTDLEDFDRAVQQGVALAKSPDAKELPGYAGN
jgi:hypothetical protein